VLVLFVRSVEGTADRSRDRDGMYRLSGARSGGGLKVEGASSAADQAAFREDVWEAALKASHAQVW